MHWKDFMKNKLHFLFNRVKNNMGVGEQLIAIVGPKFTDLILKFGDKSR